MKRAPHKLTQLSPGQFTLNGYCPRCDFAASFFSRYVDYPKSGYQIAMTCQNCSRTVLVDAGSDSRVINVFPAPHRSFPYEIEHVHELLRPALAEVYMAIEAGAFNLAVLGCRVVLERLVQGKGYRDSSTLEQRLAKLIAANPDLEAALANAEVIRLLGNDAAHNAFATFTAEQAEALIQFTEDCLRAVYVAPVHRDKLLRAFDKK